MDAKASTHFCESPVEPSRSSPRPPGRQSAYLIVLRGGIPGTMLLIDARETTLGRSSENTFALDDMTVSRHHAALRIDDRGHLTLSDLGSTNGTFVNGGRVNAETPVAIAEGDRIQLGSGVLLKLVRLDSSEEHFQLELFERAVRDGLTGVYNRTYFLNQVGKLATRSAEEGTGLAILMVDVDHFKRINDRHGHLVGDVVLRDISNVLRESTRTEDLVARYGGEEFIIALPVSSPKLAIDRADRIRRNVAARRIRTGVGEVRVTVSIGLCYAMPGLPARSDYLIQSADAALYQAKSEGRDRVVLAPMSAEHSNSQTHSGEFPARPDLQDQESDQILLAPPGSMRCFVE